MGDWNMTIRGTGVHHNKRLAQDANRMLADFCKRLGAAGHNIKAATIIYGGEEVVQQMPCAPCVLPSDYLEMRDKLESDPQAP